MEPWGNYGFNNNNNGQDRQPPADPMQELAHRLLLAQQQQQQNYEATTQATASTYYPTDNYPNDDGEPIAFDYQYQVSQRSNELRGHHQNTMALHPYQQQQSFTHENEPIHMDSLGGIQEAVARRQNHMDSLGGIQEAVARRQNQFDESTFLPSAFENNRQLLAAIAAQQQQQQQETGHLALDPSSVYTHGNREILEEPAQKRAKLQQVADNASGLHVSRLVQRRPYSPLWQDENPPSDQGANPNLDSVNALVDSIFDDVTVRESFQTDGAPLELASGGDSSFFENKPQTNGQGRDAAGLESGKKGIFDDAEDDAELSSAFSKPQCESSTNSAMDQKPPALVSGAAKKSLDDAQDEIGTVSSDAPDETSTCIEARQAASSHDAQVDADQKGKKKKSKPKPKQPLIKPLARATPKETKHATAILKNKTDLSLLLPQNACQLLASEFWIITVEQFKHAFDPSSEAYAGPSMEAFRDEIRDAIAERIVSETEAAESSNTIAGGIEPTDLERLLVVSQKDHKVGVSSSDYLKAPSTGLNPAHTDGKEEADESRERPVPANGDGIRHDLFIQPAPGAAAVDHDELPVYGIVMDEQPILIESSRNESSDFPAESLGTSERDFYGRTQDEALVAPLLGDARFVTADSHVESIEPGISTAFDNEAIQTETGSRPRDDVIMGDERRNATSDDKKITAGKILESWTNRLANWKHTQSTLDSSDTSAFSFEHALGMFLPTTIRNFLSSISVSTAFEFLSIRFTENSPGIQALFAWRKLCGLEDVKPELLAKHMAGLALRLDKALSFMPPIDAYSRQWMGTALICVTAAAKEFLIDHCKLETPEEFLDGRTSDFSEKLVKWRESKNKSVLKGSGRVAMISSFKAQVRACVIGETGEGRVTTEDEIIEQSKLLSPADYVVEVESSRKEKSKPKPDKLKVKKEVASLPKLTQKQKQISETLMDSIEFLEKVLGKENAEFLAMNGIHSPEQLFTTENEDLSSLVIEMAKWKTATSNEEVQVEACEKSLSEWKSKVKHEIHQAAVDGGQGSAKKSPPKLKVANSTNGSAPKRLRNRPRKSLNDPLHTLSSTALSFLETIDITTGEEFLSTRTSEIANALAEWREQEKMVPLKGSGCSATVSGWKAAVRKAAETSGDESLSTTEATTTSQSNKRSLPAPPQKSAVPPKINIETISHPYLLQGLPRRKFLVRNSTDPNCVYEFELSVRKPRRGLGVYLTFRGARRVLSLDGVPDSESKVPGPMVVPSHAADEPSNSYLPVLQDVTVSTKTSNASTDTFASSHSGCGIIEVGRYGAIPLSTSAPKEAASMLIDVFLKTKHSQTPMPEVKSDIDLDSDSNVLVEVSPQFGTQCFFYNAELMEKGQVIELRFSQPVAKIPSTNSSGSPCVGIVDRLSLVQSLAALSLVDLLGIIAVMSKIADSNSREIRAGTQREQIGEDVKPQQLQNFTEELKLQIVRRRVHWLATQILHILERPRETASPAEQKLVVDRAKKLLMTTEECRNLCAYANQDRNESVQMELSHEILCGAVRSNPSVNWLDKSNWCDISARLLTECLRKSSDHITANCFDLGEGNKDSLLKDIQGLVMEATKELVSNETDKSNLALPVQSELNDAVGSSIDSDYLVENYERLPKEVVAKASQVEAYRNSMALCGEVAYDDLIKTSLCNSSEQSSLVVATKSPWSRSSTIMRSTTEVEQNAAQIDTKWYIENHVLFVAAAIASSALMQCMPEKTELDTESQSVYSCFARAARSVLESDPTGDPVIDLDSSLAFSKRNSEFKRLPNEFLLSSTKTLPVPCALPLFLGVVWPRLKAAYGFSIEVSDDPADITFFPPGHQGQFHRASERQIGLQRLEKARTRRKVEQQVRGVGFGELQKLTKRMFVSAARNDMEPGQGASVKDALKQFVASILSEMPGGGNEECRRRMAAVEAAVSEFFDDIIPSMLASEKSVGNDSENTQCAYLMQVMLVLPSLLEQSGLSMRRVEDTMGVIRDVAQFVSSKNGELFPESLQVCHEEYAVGHDVHRPFLSPRIQTLAAQPLESEAASGGEGTELVREIIQPEDMHELSGFICTVLSQLLPCRATEYDLLSKGRATKGRTVGYPGLMCKHCAGKSTDGRFFFTSLDSLNTAATATLGHIYRCEFIPNELKKRIAHLKTRHPEERKALKHGAQAQFFARLWKRLWSAEGIPDTPVVLTNHQTGATDANQAVATNAVTPQQQQQQQEEEESIEFKSHVDLLTFLATTAPWNKRSDILERIRQYYAVMAHGGEIYDTNAMPAHFNSEWILSQMVPPERLAHQTFLSG